MARCGFLSASGYCLVAAALPLAPTTMGHAPPRGGQHLSLVFGVTPPRHEPPASPSHPASPWVCFILVSGTFEGRVSAPGPVNSSQEPGFRHTGPGLLVQSWPEDSRVSWLCRAGGPQTGGASCPTQPNLVTSAWGDPADSTPRYRALLPASHPLIPFTNDTCGWSKTSSQETWE